MNGYELYKIYAPINLHLKTKYDAIKYNSKSKQFSFEAYEARPDKYLFEKFARHIGKKEKAGKVCIANFMYGDDYWLSGSVDDAISIYDKWQYNRKNFSDLIESDLQTLRSSVSLDRRFLTEKTPKGNKPPLLQMVLANKVSIEFVCVYDEIVEPILKKWYDMYSGDPLLSKVIHRYIKYKGFVVNLIKEKVTDMMSENIK